MTPKLHHHPPPVPHGWLTGPMIMSIITMMISVGLVIAGGLVNAVRTDMKTDNALANIMELRTDLKEETTRRETLDADLVKTKQLLLWICTQAIRDLQEAGREAPRSC